jgi:protein-S-isoprenylcysteine O-methyltransferase Ste14
MKLAVIITGTVVIILFSWFLSISHGRYHGIPRLFAFESIFLLFLLNVRVWFHNPFSFTQITSWILLILSVYAVVEGFWRLRKIGKPGRNFENTTVLVKSGIYGLIRHPLYLSLFLVGTGIMMKDPGPEALILSAINLVAIYFTARMEEKEMTAKFGDAYRQYIKETKMFIPYIV